MNRIRTNILLALSALFIASCGAKKGGFEPKKMAYSNYRITSGTNKDANLQKILAPYADSVNKTMNGTICYATNNFEKGQPEGSLGYLITDGMLKRASVKFNKKVDVSIINNGGIRIQQLNKGAITTGKVYELMPFDNELILLQISGKELHQLLDTAAAKGGWPVSGVTFSIKDRKADNIVVGGAIIDETAIYNLAISDYLANGGDNLNFLKSVPRIQKGYLVRDALLEYFKMFCAADAAGIPMPEMNRIIKEN
jgi:2',3'-cyclic-nucleotide 2'-phosphodiesterase (5'-nucleotidase family)